MEFAARGIYCQHNTANMVYFDFFHGTFVEILWPLTPFPPLEASTSHRVCNQVGPPSSDTWPSTILCTLLSDATPTRKCDGKDKQGRMTVIVGIHFLRRLFLSLNTHLLLCFLHAQDRSSRGLVSLDRYCITLISKFGFACNNICVGKTFLLCQQAFTL